MVVYGGGVERRRENSLKNCVEDFRELIDGGGGRGFFFGCCVDLIH